MTTPSQPTSYNDLKRLAGEALAQAVTEAKNNPTLSARLTTLENAYDTSTEATANRLKDHTEQLKDHAEQLKDHTEQLKDHAEQLKDHAEALKETNRRTNWQDQRIADLSDELRNTQIGLTLAFAAIILIATVSSSFFH